MARPILYIGDVNPTLTATLYDGAGAPLDINPTIYTLKFACRLEFDVANAFGPNAAAILQVGTGQTGTNIGEVEYQPGPQDMAAFVPGIYFGQWIVYDLSLNPMHVSALQFEVMKAL